MKQKPNLKPTIFLPLLFFISALTGNAQMKYQTDDTIKINEVVVTGTPVKVNRNSVPMAVSVVNQKQIEEADESAILSVLNGRVPGLFVTERGVTGYGVADGAAGQISIRGIGGSPTTGVLILIDGHPQFMGIFGHPLPDSYVSSDVERVEVIRGPASILYGSNAMGGVINIITKKQKKQGIHGNAKLSYGSYNTQKYMGAVGYKKNRFSAYISANHDETDGHRPASYFKINNGYIKLGYDINKHFYASADFSLASFETADPGEVGATPGDSLDILRGYGAFSLQNAYKKMSGSLKAFYNFGDHDITSGFKSNDFNYGVNLFESFHFFEGNNITLGVDYMTYGGHAKNKIYSKELIDTSITEVGVYGFIQQTLAEKLTLNGGIRFQDNSIYGNQWIPSIGFAYQINGQLTWKGNISKGFRSPTVRELFLWAHNSDLQPESVMNYETGINKAFFNGKMNAELTFFAINGDNTIVYVGAPDGYANTGEIENKGIEFMVNATASKNLKLCATYCYTHMKTPVYATPEQHFFLSANYRIKKLLLTASLQHVSDMDNDSSTEVNKVSYSVVDAKASYQVLTNLNVYVSGKNLLDKDYEVNLNYPMPGATVFAGANFRF